jgi:hypothetical protein
MRGNNTGTDSFWAAVNSEGYLMAKNEQTGKKAGTAASKTLRDDRTAKDSKTAAGSALSQRPDKKRK